MTTMRLYKYAVGEPVTLITGREMPPFTADYVIEARDEQNGITDGRGHAGGYYCHYHDEEGTSCDCPTHEPPAEGWPSPCPGPFYLLHPLWQQPGEHEADLWHSEHELTDFAVCPPAASEPEAQCTLW